MRHLKKFNESIHGYFTEDEIMEIKDIFQDIIDEFNIIKEPDNTKFPNEKEDTFIIFSFLSFDIGSSQWDKVGCDNKYIDTVMVEIYTNIINIRPNGSISKVSLLGVKSYINQVIERLKLMGYSIHYVSNTSYLKINITR